MQVDKSKNRKEMVRVVLFYIPVLLLILCKPEIAKAKQPGNDSPQKAFRYLETLLIASNQVSVKYDKSTAVVINKPMSTMEEGYPLKEEGPAEDNILVMEFKMNKQTNEKFLLVFLFGPSADPAFLIYRANDFTFVASVSGTDIVIPANNTIYVAGRENNSFYKRSKLVFKQNKLEEVVQPFYYVGLQTKTLKPVTLYADKNLTTRLASLPANYDIEVLLAEPVKPYGMCSKYLVKTSYGLVGWVKINTDRNVPEGVDIKDLEFFGD